LTASSRTGAWLSVLVVTVFIALRLVLVLSNIDTIHELDRAEVKHFCLSEEFTPQELFEKYFHWLDPHGQHGGYTLNIVLYWILARVMGEGYITLKCVAIAYAAATLWIWMAILRRFFGVSTALILAALFALSSASFTAWTSTVWGSHPESCFFSALCVYLFFRRLYFHQPTRYADLLFGLLLGLCGYISLLFLPTGLLCMIFLLLRHGRKGIGRVSIMLLACVLVLAPLHYFKMKATHIPMEFTDHDLAPASAPSGEAGEKTSPLSAAAGLLKRSLENYRWTLSTGISLPVAPMLASERTLADGRLDLQRLNFAATLILLLAGALAVVRASLGKEIKPEGLAVACFIFVYPILFYNFLAYSNPFAPIIPNRYLIVGLPFLFAGISLAVSGAVLYKPSRLTRTVQVLLIPLLLVSLFCGMRDTAALVSMNTMARARDFRVIDYIKLNIGGVHMPYLDGVNRFVDHVGTHPDEHLLAGFRIVFPLISRYDCILDVPRCIEAVPNPEEIRARLGELEGDWHAREAMLRGVGWALGLKRGGDRESCRELFEAIAPHDTSALWQGFEQSILSDPAEPSQTKRNELPDGVESTP